MWMTLSCILRKGSTEEFLRHLNGVRLTIKFTVELKEDGTLLFLNTLLRRREDGSLDVSIYRKPMHMDQYFHFESHHLTHVKRGVVRCLHNRAREISTRMSETLGVFVGIKFNIRVVFKSGRTLHSMLTKVKDTLSLGKQSNVVYCIPCSCGQAYIGETKPRLETRLKEHRDAL